jgi:DNA-binding MurR/RpiR family transcriptional regulator
MRTLLREINATAAVREAIAAFAEANIPKLQQWLDKIAEKHPDKAADLHARARILHAEARRHGNHVAHCTSCCNSASNAARP